LPPPSRAELAADGRIVTNQFVLQASFFQTATNLPPGQTLERQFTVFAGPKEYQLLDRLGAQFKNNIDLVMGYGGFFGFFAKALLLSMNGLHSLFGGHIGYGLIIILITVILKALFWPLTQASTRSMKRMQALQPQMNALREKYKDDAAKMNKKLMEFMKENKVSPLGGCLPMLLQIPVFFGFFTMVRSAIELRGASFLWASDLSQPDTLYVVTWLNSLNVFPLTWLHNLPINPLPMLMGVTMIWQARLTPVSPGMDPTQQKMMKYMPLMFLFILYNYSAGLTLYWTVQNILTIAQMKLTKANTDPAAPVVGTAKSGQMLPPKKKM
jgi:YidC/Oxa1 family membrane protein insertase